VEIFLDIYHRYGPAMIASLILLPIVMMDVARMSNRFVGPGVRLRAALKDVAEGRPAQPLNFRDQDFWRELATDFNRAAGRLVQNSAELSRPTEAMPPEEAPV
jgi:nitrate/nitrite-specific signal transduction histidine kinase